MIDYHLRYFLILFFILIGVALLMVIPLCIVLIMALVKKDGFKATGWVSIVVSITASVAIIAFSLALLVLSMFSYIPWYASGILITVFLAAVVAALRPWKRSERNTMLWVMIALLATICIAGWVGSWLAHDICFTSAPKTYTFYIDRRSAGDACKKSGDKPCFTYLTFNRNASTDVIVHFHSSKLYKNPRVHFGSTGPGDYQWAVSASSHKIDIDTTRYIYYGFLRSLSPDTTYWFRVGDGTTVNNNTFTAEKKFRTAASTGDVPFVTGGDMGVTSASTTLLQQAAAKEPTYIAIGGDLAYANGIRACYPRWDTFLSNLEKYSVTPTGYTVPFIMAPGNHEAGGWGQPMKNMRFYNRYFVHEDLKGKQAWELPLHHVHYISNQVLIALDSNVVETPKSQVGWLRKVLSEAPANSLKMAMYHAPAYPSHRPLNDPESTGVREHFVPAFEDLGVTLGLENHDHSYKRSKLLLKGAANPAGVLYIGDGAMGVTARSGDASRWYLNRTLSKQFYFFMQPNNQANGISIQAYDTNNDVFDSYFMPYRN